MGKKKLTELLLMTVLYVMMYITRNIETYEEE